MRSGGREEVNMVLEMARREGVLGSSLEARVLLHVGDAGIAAQLASLQTVCVPVLPLRV